MVTINQNDEVIINPLIYLKVVGNGGRIDNFTGLYRYNGYVIEFHTKKINCVDVVRYFKDVSILYPQRLTNTIFRNKIEVEKFINLWLDNNLETINKFLNDYKWVLN